MKYKITRKRYLFWTCKGDESKISRFFIKFILLVYRLCISGTITYLCTTWTIEFASSQRGYKAYGGEYFIIPLVFYTTYKGMGFLKRLSQKTCKKEGKSDR